MNIEIITTQNEKLEESGFGTIETCNNILHSINSIGHSATLDICQTMQDLMDVVKRKPDLVILAVKYIITEDGEIIWLSEFFLENGINFSGSTRDALVFGSDKVLAKAYLKEKGINTPRYFTAVPGEYKRDYDIPFNYPLFLKTINSENINDIENSSFVNNFTEFEAKVSSLYSLHKSAVLVEEYLDGQEFSVSIIKAKGGDMLVSAIEVVAPKVEKNRMNIYKEIEKDNIKKLIKIEDEVIKNRVKNLAIDAYIDLDIRDFGQIDINTNNSGHCFFMQANLLPEMTNGISRFTEAFTMDVGISYDEIIELIVDEGISRATSK